MLKLTKKLTKQAACNDGLTSKFCLVLGLQWGREGKRKLLNKLCVDYDYSCRFNGGVLYEPNILPNGEELRMLPVGIQHSLKTKSIIGNGVIIDAKHLNNDLNALSRNGINYEDRLYISNRAHLETILHKKVARRLREIRNDTIWINGEDVSMAFKPMKMGLRIAHLADNWNTFEEKYKRVRSTYEELFKIQVSDEEVKEDLERLHFLQSRLKKHRMIQDTVVMLNQKIAEGKRILVEDCSSSLMDVDFGVYPYTDSFNTTTGAVCTGLGVPEEVIETTIGVMSVTSLIRRAFLNHIKTFPSKVDAGSDPDAYESLHRQLKTKYEVDMNEYDFGWPDLNPIRHAHMLNNLSSIYLTNLDVLDELEDIKICKKYKIAGKLTEDGIQQPDVEVEGIHPTIINDFERLTPVYQTLKGWKQDITEIEDFDLLPENCKSMIKEIEKHTKVPVKYISVNNEEDDGLLRIMR